MGEIGFDRVNLCILRVCGLNSRDTISGSGAFVSLISGEAIS